MENKKKVEEPFDPKKTPNPPQIIEPNNRKQDGEKEPEKKPEGERQQPDARNEANPPRKLLGESELEIEDETTI